MTVSATRRRPDYGFSNRKLVEYSAVRVADIAQHAAKANAMWRNGRE
jgi:hypothetical protein